MWQELESMWLERAGILYAGHVQVAAHMHVNILACQVAASHAGVLAGNRGQLFPGDQLGVLVGMVGSVGYLAAQCQCALYAQRVR